MIAGTQHGKAPQQGIPGEGEPWAGGGQSGQQEGRQDTAQGGQAPPAAPG